MFFLLNDETASPDCLYFLRYWSICVLQLLASIADSIIRLINTDDIENSSAHQIMMKEVKNTIPYRKKQKSNSTDER